MRALLYHQKPTKSIGVKCIKAPLSFNDSFYGTLQIFIHLFFFSKSANKSRFFIYRKTITYYNGSRIKFKGSDIGV